MLSSQEHMKPAFVKVEGTIYSNLMIHIRVLIAIESRTHDETRFHL